MNRGTGSMEECLLYPRASTRGKHRTCAFLLDERLAIDAGSLTSGLDLSLQYKLEAVLVSHSHLDHIRDLATIADNRAQHGCPPLQVVGTKPTLEVLRKHFFNDLIWPDFSRIPSPEAPLVSFHELAVGEVLQVGGKSIEVLPAVHTVPAVGYAVSCAPGPWWVFSGDTERNPAFWQRVNRIDVAMLIIETAFSDRERELAQRSLHLAPSSLADELDQIDRSRRFPIYITHTKPAETGLIMEEIRRFDDAPNRPGDVRHDIRWLSAGQTFEL